MSLVVVWKITRIKLNCGDGEQVKRKLEMRRKWPTCHKYVCTMIKSQIEFGWLTIKEISTSAMYTTLEIICEPLKININEMKRGKREIGNKLLPWIFCGWKERMKKILSKNRRRKVKSSYLFGIEIVIGFLLPSPGDFCQMQITSAFSICFSFIKVSQHVI